MTVALAGAGLRWNWPREAVESPVAAAPPSSSVPPATAKSLAELPRSQRLSALAAALPGMTASELAPLVAHLAGQVQEGGSGPGTEDVELLLRLVFTRWAELDAPGVIAALESAEYQYSHTTRRMAVSAWAELRGIAALESAQAKWPGIASWAAWEVLERCPEQMEALIPLLDRNGMPRSDHALHDRLGPERWVHLSAAMGEIGYVWGEMRELGPTDFPLALRIAKSLPPGAARESALGTVLEFLHPHHALYDSVRARGVSLHTEYEALPPGRARDELSPVYASLLALDNASSALTWARALPDPDVRRKALGAIARSLPEGTSPAEAGFLPDELHNEAPAPEESITAPVPEALNEEAWAAAGLAERRRNAAATLRDHAASFTSDLTSDNNKAVALFETMVPEERTLGAWYEVTRARIGTDIGEASQWVQQLPPGPSRDAAATALVESLLAATGAAGDTLGITVSLPGNERDPETAFTWAAHMSGEAERTRYLTLAAKAWALDDASAARAAVAASSLPDAAKEDLLRQLPEGGAR